MSFPFLREEDVDQILSYCTFCEFNKKEVFLPLGQVAQFYYFLIEGTVRAYSVDDAGNDSTIMIHSENALFGSLESLYRSSPTKRGLQAAEASKLMKIRQEDFQQLAFSNVRIAKMYMTGSTLAMLKYLDHIELLSTKIPEERYLETLKNNPEVFQKVRHKDIATLLGITPNSLSRIIKRQNTTSGRVENSNDPPQ
ncbi:MAG: Crp/Fnr family transcriptional regulator [Saprospiraceae bacterium]|nr:Crp/Fnr family transcriptional regulator [Saprospiraceae bacterium]